MVSLYMYARMCIQSVSYFIPLRNSALPSHTPLALVVEFTHEYNKQSLHAFSVLFTFENKQKSTKYKHVTQKWL